MTKYRHITLIVFILLSPLLGKSSNEVSIDIHRQRIKIAGIALAQAERMSGQWDSSTRDCAGLIRFSYFKAFGQGSQIWRNAKGEKVSYLSAAALIAYNFESISFRKDLSDLKTGDVLAFYDKNKHPNEAWHLMMVVAPGFDAADKRLVVYHNGAQGKAGKVRKVWLDDFLYTNSKWQPLKRNPLFKGVYRYKEWVNGNNT